MQNILARSKKPLVGEESILKNKSIIDDASMIRVQVIKKKYLDQIKELNLTHDDSFINLEMIILGYCDPWIIFSDQTKALMKMSRSDFIQYSLQEDPVFEGITEDSEKRKLRRSRIDEIGRSLDLIPRLFVD